MMEFGPGAAALAVEDAARVREAVKDLLRIGSAAEDALIARLATEAAATAEAFLGLVLVAREVRATVAASGAWVRLPACPVTAVTAVTGLDAAGGEVALAAEAYAVDIDADGDGWVRVTAPGVARVRVTLSAGLAADWEGVPAPVRMAVVRLAAHGFATPPGGAAPPAAVAALLRPWRRLRLHPGHAA